MYFLSFFFNPFLPSFLSRFALTFPSSSSGGIEERPYSGETKKTHILLTQPIKPVLPASHEKQKTQPSLGHGVGYFIMISHVHVCSCTTKPGR